MHRKSTPEVRGGRVRKKNNHLANPTDFYRVEQSEVRVVRERPGAGYRHVLTVAQVADFLRRNPELTALFDGLDAVVLKAGEPGLYGRYDVSGVISLHAYPRGLTDWMTTAFYEANRGLLERLGLETAPTEYGPDWLEARWTEEQARAFLLLDVLPHELGHHVDRMTSRRRRDIGRGEPFAETYARDLLPGLWDRYGRAPRR